FDMKNIILFDDDSREHFLPLTFTRPVGELRIGILTIREKWEKWLDGKASYITQEYLNDCFPINIESDNYIINSSVLPSHQLCSIVRNLQISEAVLKDGELIATRLNEKQIKKLMKDEEIEELKGYELEDTPLFRLKGLTDLFQRNEEAIQSDFNLITNDRVSQSLSESNLINGAEHIFVEEGAEVECSILNASTGPIYIGKNAKILEGSMLRGPIAIGDNTVIKMGAKIYGGTTFGPYCKAGGEIKNSIFQGYTNKGHDGYLGDSILGEWCNLGAGTNVSNLKNNYSTVKQWNYSESTMKDTELQFCGLVMGDYSKSSIATKFNTGTVVGVCANVFGDGFPPKFVPSFTWGNDCKETFVLEKGFEMIERNRARRALELSVEERLMLVKVFEETTKHRVWEKQTIAV
ncbi:MAG: putative sugar nucleotidyl transferase, partial [Bacteroidota bacterium]